MVFSESGVLGEVSCGAVHTVNVRSLGPERWANTCGRVADRSMAGSVGRVGRCQEYTVLKLIGYAQVYTRSCMASTGSLVLQRMCVYWIVWCLLVAD